MNDFELLPAQVKEVLRETYAFIGDALPDIDKAALVSERAAKHSIRLRQLNEKLMDIGANSYAPRQ